MADGFEGPERGLHTSDGARGAASQARDAAATAGRDLLDRAVEKKDELKQRAAGAVDQQRVQVAGRVDAISRALHGAASSLREDGETQLSSWVEQAAGQVERLVGYMQGKPADGMLHDFEDLARRNPALFLGGTYLAGMAVGRFLRASAPAPRVSDDAAGAFGEGPTDFTLPESGITGGATGAPWTGVGVAPSAQGTDPAFGTSDGFASRGTGFRASDAGDGEPGLTDEDLRDAWHGADETRRADRPADSGYGASRASGSDSFDTGELTRYTNGAARDDDPRGGF